VTPNNWQALHFLLSDLTGISAGFVLFSLLALLPGYAIGWLTNVLGFRRRSLPFRLAASVPVSLSVAPIIGYTIGRWLGLDAVWIVYAVLCVAAVAAGALRRDAFSAPGFRRLWPFFALIAAWIGIASLSLADLPFGHRLYFSIIDFDYSVRIALTHSISAFGVPARNPFFFPDHAVDLRYHYLWLIVCAQIDRLGAPLSGTRLIDTRTAVIAGTLWVGIGLIALIPLYLRLFISTGQDLLRQSRIGIALLAVTGLDIVPALLLVWASRAGIFSEMSPSVEWWNEQVDGWLYTMLWEPHYICALVACLTGFLVLWTLPPQASRRERIVSGLVAGIAFATAAGSGIYVAAVFGAFLAIWFVVLLARKLRREAEAMAIAGIVAIALIYPFFASLQGSLASVGSGAPAGVGAAQHLFRFTVRAFAPVSMVFGSDWPWQRYLANLLLLPLNYFIELGIFFAAGHLFWTRFRARKRAATLAELAALLMLATSVVICTFVKSTAILNNDLGWRGFLPAQFILLLWAANLLSERALRTKLATLLIVLGVAGAAYDLAILRFYPVLADFGKVPKIVWLGADRQVGFRTLANREAYEWIRARTPETAVIQQNPETLYQDTFFGAYGDRQTIAVGYLCGASLGGDPRECQSTMAILVPLFAGGGAQVLASACSSLPMDFAIAKDTDKAWHDPSSWVWTGAPVFSNDFTRVFACKPDTRR
jgi:hypothetical protein